MMDFINKDLYKNSFGIYCIYNVISNKYYIGQTRQKFIKRYYHHCWKLNNGTHDNTHLQRAWNLYGENFFVFLPLKIVDNPDLLNDLEIEYIDLYKEKQQCYNIIDGGGGRRGVPLTEEHKRKIGETNRQRMLGKKASEETKLKMSLSRKGRILKHNGIVLNEELAYIIKTKLINGKTPSGIAKELNIAYKHVNNILSNNSWSTVHVDGWDEFIANRKTYTRLTKKDHEEIYRLHIEENFTKHELAKLYNKTVSMIELIFRKQRKIHCSN